MKTIELFEGKDVLARANLHGKSGNLVVTFSAKIPFRYVPGPGFAEEPLNRLHIDNIVFINKWNHWWQTPEMVTAVERASGLISEVSPSRISAYGSSMGAYGALLFSGALRCTHVLALGPQYSIDRNKVPFERRWKESAKTLSFNWDDMDAALQSPADKFVLYDNNSADRYHLELMEGKNLHKLAIPFSSHAVGRFFKDTKQLKAVFTALVGGDLENQLPSLIRRARAERKSSPAYMLSLLEKLESAPHHQKSALRMAQIFVREKPRQFKLRNKLARLLLQDGQILKAQKHAQRAVELNKRNVSSLMLLREVHDAHGDARGLAQVNERISSFKIAGAANEPS